jgi:uncharacterized delta-60 repeat protein
MKLFLLLSIIVLIYSVQSFSQPGTLDNSFSNDGKTSTLVGTVEADGECVAVQSNGKIIMAGTYYNTSHNDYDFAVVRYNVNGTLDNSFAGNGKADINPSLNTDDIANAVAIQSNGMIIIAGSSGSSLESPDHLAVVRLKTNGNLDSSFGAGGIVRIPLIGSIKSVAIQQDGRIVLAGDVANSTFYDFAVIRLLSSGALDKSFGNNGEVFTDFVGGNDNAESVAIQSNGKIVVGGSSSSANIYNFAVAQYKSNGTLDSSFNNDGKVRTAIGSERQCFANAIAIQGNGKILAAGNFINSITSKSEFAVVRYNTNGTLDNSFAGNGKLGISFGGTDNAYSLAIQSNGKIIVAGVTENNAATNDNFAIARVHSSDGTLDAFFGNGGKVTTNFGGYDYGLSTVIDATGRIIVGGLSITDKRRFAVARYLTSGTSLIADNENNAADSKTISKEFKVYPNPANDVIHIDGLTFSPAFITIQDELGNTLIKEPIADKNQTINIQSLKPGIYNITVLQNGKSMNAKFIRQ